MANIEDPGEVPGVNVSSSQGIQVGSGNVQYNAPKQPLDPFALSHLNPHIAVTRLQQLSHDELVDFFARATPLDVGGVIEAFCEVDGTQMVAALGDIRRPKAIELIGALDDDYSFYFAGLPEAAEAITRKAVRLGWSDRQPLVSLGSGYARKYREGSVFWSVETGAWTTVGAIDDGMDESDRWGYPSGDQEIATSSPFGTAGIRQKFRRGMVYSSKHGVFCVLREVCYKAEGGSGGWLGFPTREVEDNPGGQHQNFEGGTIYFFHSASERAFAVRREVVDALPASLGVHPVSKEATTVSSSGKQRMVQHFESMKMIETSTGNVIPSFEAAVYWDKRNKPVIVAQQIWKYYSKLGAEKSWLGFPVNSIRRGWWRFKAGVEFFEGGSIYWRSGSDPIAVRKAVDDFIWRDHVNRRLGFPVTEEQPFGADGSSCIQFFEHGVLTLRDGKFEIWVKPAKEEATPKPIGTPFRNPYGPSGFMCKPPDKP